MRKPKLLVGRPTCPEVIVRLREHVGVIDKSVDYNNFDVPAVTPLNPEVLGLL